jgi:Fe-S cluster assembly protein SufD
MLVEAPERVRGRFGALADPNAHRFAALNASFPRRGRLDRASSAARHSRGPIYLLFISAPEAQEALIQPRVLIEAGTDARATVVEHHVSAGAAVNLTNIVTELVAPGRRHRALLPARGRRRRISSRACMHGSIAASVMRAHSASAGARLARRDLHCVLAGEGAGRRSTASSSPPRAATRISTCASSMPCRTRAAASTIAASPRHGRGVFGGRVVVQPGAQRTDAHQSSRNLLSPTGGNRHRPSSRSTPTT